MEINFVLQSIGFLVLGYACGEMNETPIQKMAFITTAYLEETFTSKTIFYRLFLDVAIQKADTVLAKLGVN